MSFELVELSQRYGRRLALDRVSLELRAGECYALVGPNGAGKTTLLRQALLLQPLARGAAVRVDGIDARRSPRAALALVAGTVEVAPVWPGLAVRRHLELQGLLVGLGRAAARVRADELLEMLGLRESAREQAGRLSQGQRQRLALACALVGRPRYLLLDEPTNALDPEGIAELRGIVLDEVRQRGTGVLVSSHQLAEVEQWSDRAAFLRGGRLVREVERGELERRARERRLLRTADDARAASWLAGAGWKSSAVSTGGLVVELGERSARELSLGLAREGLGLDELSPVGASLEELYLALTQEPEGAFQQPLPRPALATPAAAPAPTASPVGPPRPRTRAALHEWRRVLGRPRAWMLGALPALAAGLAMQQSAWDAARQAAEVEGGELYSATAGNAFHALAGGLRVGLPLLAWLGAAAGALALAGEVGRGTHRWLSVAPVGRGPLVDGKLASLVLRMLLSCALLFALCLLIAALHAPFGDVVEILPNGKEYPLVTAAELWPALRESLPSLASGVLAMTGLGFLVSALARGAAGALLSALGLYLVLELLRAPARALAMEAWLPTSYLPSPLADRSLLARFADLASGVSNPLAVDPRAALLVPLAWLCGSWLVARLVWNRRSLP